MKYLFSPPQAEKEQSYFLAQISKNLNSCQEKYQKKKKVRDLESSLQKFSLEEDSVEIKTLDKKTLITSHFVLPLREDSAYSLLQCDCHDMAQDPLSDELCIHLFLALKISQKSLVKEQKKQDDKKKPADKKLLELLRDYWTKKQEDSEKNSLSYNKKRLAWLLTTDFQLRPCLEVFHQQEKTWTWKHLNCLQELNTLQELLEPIDQILLAEALCQEHKTHELFKLGLSPERLLSLAKLKNIYISEKSYPVQVKEKKIIIYWIKKEGAWTFQLSLSGKILNKESLELKHQTLVLAERNEIICSFLPKEEKDFMQKLLSLGSIKLWKNQVACFFGLWETLNAKIRFSFLEKDIDQRKTAQINLIFRLTPQASEGASLRLMAKILPLNQAIELSRKDLAIIDFFAADGRACRLIRDEDLEKKWLTKVLEELGFNTLASQSLDPYQKNIESDEQVLLFLEKLKNHPDKELFTVEWPKDLDKEYKLSEESMDEGKLDLSLKKSQDWLNLAGFFRLGGDILELESLLAAISSGKKYVRLHHRKWLKITQAFEKRLKLILEASRYQKDQTEAKILNCHQHLWSKILDDEKINLEDEQKSLLTADLPKKSSDFKAPKTLLLKLRSYQEEGFLWLRTHYENKTPAILADDMGLGKTFQTLALLEDICEHSSANSLIIAPTSVIQNWQQECLKLSKKLRPFIHHGKNRLESLEALPSNSLIISSYGLLRHDFKWFSEKKWNLLVFDEAQELKNPNAKISTLAKELEASWKLALSGTPVENNIFDLWSLFNCLSPKFLGPLSEFKKEFSETNDLSEIKNLKKIISPFILRREKKDYLHELPAKTELTRLVQLSSDEKTFYENIRLKAIASLGIAETINLSSQEMKEKEKEKEPQKNIEILSALSKLRQTACHPALIEPSWPQQSSKHQKVLQLLTQLMSRDHQVLVFSQFSSQLELLSKSLQLAQFKHEILSGKTSQQKRVELVSNFQNGAFDIFLISLKAGGTGLNLTRADYVIHLDPWWNPAASKQASDRAYRMGQKRPVTVYHFISAETIEEKVAKLSASKAKLFDSLLVAKKTPNYRELLSFLT